MVLGAVEGVVPRLPQAALEIEPLKSAESRWMNVLGAVKHGISVYEKRMRMLLPRRH